MNKKKKEGAAPQPGAAEEVERDLEELESIDLEELEHVIGGAQSQRVIVAACEQHWNP